MPRWGRQRQRGRMLKDHPDKTALPHFLHHEIISELIKSLGAQSSVSWNRIRLNTRWHVQDPVVMHCNSVFYNEKYIFGLRLISGSELLNPFQFPKWWEQPSYHFYVNEVTLRRHLRMGAGCQETQPWDQRLELSVLPPTLTSGEGRGTGSWISHQWPKILSAMPR